MTNCKWKKSVDMNWTSWLTLKKYPQQPWSAIPTFSGITAQAPEHRWIHGPTWVATGPNIVSKFPGHNDYPRCVHMIQDRPNKILLGIFSTDTGSDLILFDHRELSMWVQMCHSYVSAKSRNLCSVRESSANTKIQSWWCGVWF